jgi:hypothetical protein
VRSTAWYHKTRPTFADALALVRRQLWDHLHFSMSQQALVSGKNYGGDADIRQVLL